MPDKPIKVTFKVLNFISERKKVSSESKHIKVQFQENVYFTGYPSQNWYPAINWQTPFC